jgi:ribA/ribD-fused uncharacterized protein
MDGNRYKSVDHYVREERERLFKNEEHLERIMEGDSRKSFRKIRKEVHEFNERLWTSILYNVVLRATIEKYRQNEELLDLLLKSWDFPFINASPYDRLLGIGLHPNHQDATKPEKWTGKNILGKALMVARATIRQEML